MDLVVPALEHLPSYVDALTRGWSPMTTDDQAGRRELTRIEADPAAFVAELDSIETRGRTLTLGDGSHVPLLPGFRRWMWDGEFCGSIGLRWSPDGGELPEYCLGHIGYTVVPWRRRRGYASAALQQMLPAARRRGMDFVELTTDVDNLPSQKVIIANGGRLVERFTAPAVHGGHQHLRWRIDLP